MNYSMKLAYFTFCTCLIIYIMVSHNESLASGCLKFDDLVSDNSSILKKIKPQISMNLLWTDIIGCGSCGHYMTLYPLCSQSDIFVADRFGVIKRLNLYTGKCIWLKKLSDVVRDRSSTCISNGMAFGGNCLYVGSESGAIYALDIDRGDIIWIARIFGEIISTPVVRQGLVLVYTSNGVLYALNKKDGSVKWTVAFDIPIFSFLVTILPAVAGDIVIIGDSGGVVSACDIQTGQLIWQKKIFNIKGTTDIDRLSDIIAPIVIKDIVYAIAYNGNMVALDLVSGSIIWSKDIGTLVNIKIEDGIIYLIDQSNRIVALNAFDGSIIWRKSNWMYCQLTWLSPYKDCVLFSDSNGYLYWIRKENGVFVGKYKIGFTAFSKLLIIFDKIVIYEKNGKISVWDVIDVGFKSYG